MMDLSRKEYEKKTLSKSNEHGFTSAELMVAITVLFIIIGFIYSTHYFSLKMSKRWSEKTDLIHTAALCMNRLTQDIIHAWKFQSRNKNDFVLILSDDKKITYELQNKNLYRNGLCMNVPNVAIYDLSFCYTEKDADTQLFFSSDSMVGQTIRDNPVITIEMTLGNFKKRITIQSTIRPRNMDKASFEFL